MRNKKDLHVAACISELDKMIEIPDKLKNLDVLSYVFNNN